MEIKIRQEEIADHPVVFDIVKAAFEKEAYSDQTEHFLVDRLRKSAAFVPELSLVASFGSELVGHILLTKIQIKNDKESFPSLALAPVSVLPRFQKKGIGGQLILAAHQRAIALGFGSIVLLGHEAYYPRFGYEQTSKFGVRLPFEAPAENCMVIELRENALNGVSGEVVYSPAFFETS